MALLTIPSAGTPIRLRDVMAGLFASRRSVLLLERDLEAYLGTPWCRFVNSGTTAFYVTLRALRHLSGRTEVVLPAYTAPSLTLPIRKAGLRPVLCDISLETFNLDPDRLADVVGDRALCVVPVHMFGLPCDMQAVRRAVHTPEVFIVEDAASALGSTLSGRPVGTFGDIGFFSFNRGKNLSILAGGCLTTDQEDLVEPLEQEWATLRRLSLKEEMALAVKMAGLSLAVRPLFYTLFYSFIARHKYTEPHTDFISRRYTSVQAAAGRALLRRMEGIFRRREENGTFLYEALSGMRGLRLPRVAPQARPIFNQFPVLVRDRLTRDRLHERIRGLRVESTLLYPEPIHRLYDLGYDLANDPFPNATLFSRRLLLIPCHPLVGRRRLEEVVRVVREELARPGERTGSREQERAVEA